MTWSSLLGDRELKYDEHSKKCDEFFGKSDAVLERDPTCGAEIIGKVPIKRGIFQRDALSPLLFVIALIALIHILKPANPEHELQTGEAINHVLLIGDLKLYSKS